MQNQQLIDARKAKGMTQAELAQAMHVSRQTVSHWENGRVAPDEAAWRQLSQLLDLQMDKPQSQPGNKSLWIAAIAVLAVGVLLIALHFLLPGQQPDQPQYDWAWYHSQQETAADAAQLSFQGEGPVPLTRVEDGSLWWRVAYTLRENHGVSFTIDRMTESYFNADHQILDSYSMDAEGAARFFDGGVIQPGGNYYHNVNRPQGQDVAYALLLEGTDANGNALAFGYVADLSQEIVEPMTRQALRDMPSQLGVAQMTPVENPAPLLTDWESFPEDGQGWFYGVTIQNVGTSGSFTPVSLTEYYFSDGNLDGSSDFDADFLVQCGSVRTYQPGDSFEFTGGQPAPGSTLTQVGYELVFTDENGDEQHIAAVVDMQRP